jgi:ABC-type nitrate/sulfonate/bicarbonate transport system ATPase subunit
MITYNVDEAILLSDKVVMMSPGPKAQITDTLDIAYNRPRNIKNILENDNYYSNRDYLINFLEQ